MAIGNVGFGKKFGRRFGGGFGGGFSNTPRSGGIGNVSIPSFSKPSTKPIDQPTGQPAVVPPPPPINIQGGGIGRVNPPAPPPPPPVTITAPGTTGRVNPPTTPITPPADPWATWGAQFDPRVNVGTWYSGTASLRTSLLNSMNALKQGQDPDRFEKHKSWSEFAKVVGAALWGDMGWVRQEREVEWLIQTPEGWLKASQIYMEAKGFYTPKDTTTTTTDTDNSQYMIPGADARKQLLADEKYRTRYLDKANQLFGSQLNMDQFLAMLNSTQPMVIQMFEDMHEKLKQILQSPTGSFGG